MKKRLWLKILLSIPVILLIVWGAEKTRQGGLKRFREFNNAHIEGTISNICTKHKGIAIIVENGPQYVFYPQNIDYSGGYFLHIAQQGDMVKKESKNDTLSLYKNGEVYKFTFKKLE